MKRMKVVLSEDRGRFILAHPKFHLYGTNAGRMIFKVKITFDPAEPPEVEEFIPVEVKETITREANVIGLHSEHVRESPMSVFYIYGVNLRQHDGLEYKLFRDKPIRDDLSCTDEAKAIRKNAREIAYIFARCAAENYNALAQCQFQDKTGMKLEDVFRDKKGIDFEAPLVRYEPLISAIRQSPYIVVPKDKF